MPQWMLRITKYADRLLSDLEELDWPEPIKEAQRQWIGRSEGALLKFKVENKKSKVESNKLGDKATQHPNNTVIYVYYISISSMI